MKRTKILPLSAALLLMSCSSPAPVSSASSSSVPPVVSSQTSSSVQPASSSPVASSSSAPASSQVSTQPVSSLPVSSSSSVAPSSSSSSEVKKATIELGTLAHVTASLVAGQYELNQPIDFTIAADDEYDLGEVKVNGETLVPEDGIYCFTPTEEKTYTLTASATENPNKVALNFADKESLHRKGVQVKLLGVDIDEYIVDGKLVLSKDIQFRVLGQLVENKNNRWIRKITFVCSEGLENIEASDLDEHTSYANGVWSDSRVRTDNGAGDVLFKAKGKVVITKILVETAATAFYEANVIFSGLKEGDKIYMLTGTRNEDYEAKTPLTSDTKFYCYGVYYFVVEPNDLHAKYYEDWVATSKGIEVRYDDIFIGEANPKKIRIFRFAVPSDGIGRTYDIALEWIGKSAAKSLKIDDESAIKYVRGYMETNPFASLGFLADSAVYGSTNTLYLSPKAGYEDLKFIFNGEEVPNVAKESGGYEFKFRIAERDENTFAFSAVPVKDVDTRIALTGENADKGELYGDVLNDQFYFAFAPSKAHPTAKVTALSFDGTVLVPQEKDESVFYVLSKEQMAKLFAAPNEEAKSALFSVTIAETPYQCAVSVNSGNFAVKLEKKADGTYEVVEPSSVEEPAYSVAGGTPVRLTLTPNENFDMYAVELNDVRLTAGQYEKKADGSIVYEFIAIGLKAGFLVQTVPQKVAITVNITKGYKVTGLPAGEVECGQPLSLKLEPVDESHWLFGKKIAVTYNGQPVTVNAQEFTFGIVPVKSGTTLAVTVEDQPLD